MKTLRYFFVAALAMMAGNVMADDVTFDFTDATKIASYGLTAPANNGESVEITQFTAQGYTIVAGGSPSTATRLYKSSPSSGEGAITLRIYKNATLTIKSNVGSIKNITFDTNANDGFTTTVGAYNDGVWAGEASEITFTVSKTIQIKTITISQEGGVTPPPTPEVEEITVAKAIEIANALADNQTTDAEYKIKGFVVGTPTWKEYKDSQTGEIKNYNLSLYVADTKGDETGAIYVYNIFNTEKTYFPTIDENIVAGAAVELQGKLQKYVKNENVTPEVVKAHFLSIGGGGETGLETVWDFTVLPTAKIDGAGNIETNATDGIFVEDEGAAWQQAYNKAELPDGTEFISNADGTVFEPTKHLVWSALSSNKMVFYRNYPPAYGGKHLFFNKEAEVMIPCKAGQVIEMMMTGSKVTTKKITSQDVVETFDDGGTPVGGVKLDITTAYGDYFPVTLTAKVENVYLTFESTLCIQKITVKDGGSAAIAAVKTANKVANNVMYNLAGQKVGKDFKGIVIVNGKKMLNK